MVNYKNTNPIIGDPSMVSTIQFRQTRESLLDTEDYSRFIYSVENQFRRGRFYKDYKSSIMQKDLNVDQIMRGINSEMAAIELHHHLPSLNSAAITITEYLLNTVGSVNTMMVIRELEECHRNNMMAVIMLSETNHQMYHNSNGTAFIPLDMCWGNPFKFLDKYGKYLTLDLAFQWMLQFKQEEANNHKMYWPAIARAREQLLDWSNSGYIQY